MKPAPPLCKTRDRLEGGRFGVEVHRIDIGRTSMRNAVKSIAMSVLLVLTHALVAQAQRQVAPPITDSNDPKFITAQTRKQGGPMPAEQMALVFDHLDHALKV